MAMRQLRIDEHKRWGLLPIGLALLVVLLSGQPAAAQAAAAQEKDDPFAWRWYEVDSQNQVQVNLFVFYRDNCPHCEDGLEFADRLRQHSTWLRVRKYETGRHAGNLELYRRMAASLQRRGGTVPAFFYCGQMTLGFSSEATTGRSIEARLKQCRDHLQSQLDARSSGSSASRDLPRSRRGPTSPWLVLQPNALGLAVAVLGSLEPEPAEALQGEDGEDSAGQRPPQHLELQLPPPAVDDFSADRVEMPVLGERRASDLSLPALTLILAGCDAFNPCAFFVLLSLLSLMIHARSRGRMLLVGGIFVLCSGVFYFLFMAAWLNVFLLAGHLHTITLVAGALAVVVSLINIKDYFAFQRGVTLSLPERSKPRLFDRMRKLVSAVSLWPVLLGTLALAAVANSYELLCTAGFPMVFTRVLTLRELSTPAYYGYLGLYNLIYVIPLAAIVLAFTWTLGTRKLQQHEGRILKLLSGVMMLLLGLVILLRPAMLQSVGTAILLLVGSLGLTATVVLLDRWFHWTSSRQPVSGSLTRGRVGG